MVSAVANWEHDEMAMGSEPHGIHQLPTDEKANFNEKMQIMMCFHGKTSMSVYIDLLE